MFSDTVTPRYMPMCSEGNNGEPCKLAFGGAHCVMCRRSMTIEFKKKGKQMDYRKGDKVRVEFEGTIGEVRKNAIAVVPDGWQPIAHFLVDPKMIKEVTERVAPKVGTILGWNIIDSEMRMRVVAVDGEMIFGRFVTWDNGIIDGGWRDGVWNGQTHGCQHITGYRVIDAATAQ